MKKNGKAMILVVTKTRENAKLVTKSGGMLIGSVKEVGLEFHDQSLSKGTK